MDKERREYGISVTINGKRLTKIIIDSHYEVKHSSSVDDEIIIRLVLNLDGLRLKPEGINVDGYEYYVDELTLNGKLYKLIWLLKKGETYIGIVNCYRRN